MSMSSAATLVSHAAATARAADASSGRSSRRAPRRSASPARFVVVSAVLHIVTLGALAGLSIGGAPAGQPTVVAASFDSGAVLAPAPEEPPPLPQDLPPRLTDQCEPAADTAPLQTDAVQDQEFTDARSVIAVADRFARNSRLPARPRHSAGGEGDGTVAGPVSQAVIVAPPAPAPPSPPPCIVERTPLRIVSSPAPVYPESARASGVAGVVRLVAEVLEDGTVGEVEVVESSGFRSLDDAAIRAVRAWRFDPERIDGVAQRTRVRIPDIRFRLDR